MKIKPRARRGGSAGALACLNEIPAARAQAAGALTWAAARLDHAEFPRLTAQALLAHVLGITRTQLLTRTEQSVPAAARTAYERLVERAAAGEPLAFLTGRREFYGLDFSVDARVLVPRPETELLVDLALAPARPGSPSALHIVDIGTGSGCIAVSLAVHLPQARITALDISPEALALAGRNAAHHHVAERITFVHSDLLSALALQPSPREADTRSRHAERSFDVGHSPFDLICANLPYIPSAELRGLPVAAHEPALALDGGPDGLGLIRRLLGEAPGFVAPGARLLLEIGAAQAEAVVSLARAAFPSARVNVHQDWAGLDRVLSVAT